MKHQPDDSQVADCNPSPSASQQCQGPALEPGKAGLTACFAVRKHRIVWKRHLEVSNQSPAQSTAHLKARSGCSGAVKDGCHLQGWRKPLLCLSSDFVASLAKAAQALCYLAWVKTMSGPCPFGMAGITLVHHQAWQWWSRSDDAHSAWTGALDKGL